MHETAHKCHPIFQIFEVMGEEGEIAHMEVFSQARDKEELARQAGCQAGSLQMPHWPAQ